MALDLVSVKELAPHLVTRMLLSPMLWDKFKIASAKLKWKQARFTRSNVSKIPNKRGVYAFLIRNNVRKASWPPHGYIMYVGIVGRRKAERTLRERFSEYLTPSEVAKRPKIARMIETWGEHLYFNYAVVS